MYRIATEIGISSLFWLNIDVSKVGQYHIGTLIQRIIVSYNVKGCTLFIENVSIQVLSGNTDSWVLKDTYTAVSIHAYWYRGTSIFQ